MDLFQLFEQLLYMWIRKTNYYAQMSTKIFFQSNFCFECLLSIEQFSNGFYLYQLTCEQNRLNPRNLETDFRNKLTIKSDFYFHFL